MREMAFPALRMRGDAGQDTTATDTGGEEVAASLWLRKKQQRQKRRGGAEKSKAPRRVLYGDTDWLALADNTAGGVGVQEYRNDGQGGDFGLQEDMTVPDVNGALGGAMYTPPPSLEDEGEGEGQEGYDIPARGRTRRRMVRRVRGS